MNNVNIIGNITKDIELKYTQNNKAVVTVSIAVNEGYGENQKTYFIDVQVWEKQAENLQKYCGKGSKIAVSGKLIQQTWEHEGKNKSKVLVQAFNIMFLDSKKEEQQTPTEAKAVNEESDPFQDFGKSHEEELDNLDLPF
ncbi:MAG TPA: single-stranded DNA-binding protein [Gallicola sp.]|nr:single-stranded DNA-binding protein [Gallicola sp.]